EALDMAVPAPRDQPSARQDSGSGTPPEYDEGGEGREGGVSGKLSIQGVSLSAGKAVRGERGGLGGTQDDGCYEV
ncbi:IS481 family transposase, partial [Enterobacter bugandensis]|nr:IS481 family transposase [Enterobacter bugandensis]